MGDILLTKSGSIGDAVLIDKHLEFSLFESVALIKLNKKVINPLFLSFLLNQSSVGFFYKRNTKGITIKHLHLVDIKRIPIIVPAQQKQNEFCFKVQKIKDQENLLLKFLQESENLFNSLLQKAFKGEL
jgi:type I restriction enzyme S subunit